MSTIILTRQDILGLITMPETLEAVEAAFTAYAAGQALMPPKAYLTLKYGDFRAMPAAVPQGAGVKWINVHPDNASLNLPSIMGIIIYSDPDTGYPLAIIDGTEITAYRTGAAAAIASKYLSPKNARSLGLVGAGHQADTQLSAHREFFDFDDIRVYDKSITAAESFKMRHPELPISIASLEIACGADIICTLTPSRTPYLKREWIKPAAHINAIGADAAGKQELEPGILLEGVVIVDDIYQATHAGELNVSFNKGIFTKDQIYASLGEITSGQKPGRQDNQKITIFDSTGLAIQDIACAKIIYEKAKDAGIGKTINLVS